MIGFLERKGLQRKLAVLLLVALLPLFMQSRAALAGMVSTDSVLNAASGYDRTSILARLQKEEARATLVKLGVDMNLVQQRIMKMTPDELVRFNEAVQAQPAGGESVIGVVLFVLVLLIILDLLGATDVFPAIKPIK